MRKTIRKESLVVVDKKISAAFSLVENEYLYQNWVHTMAWMPKKKKLLKAGIDTFWKLSDAVKEIKVQSSKCSPELRSIILKVHASLTENV